MSCAKRDEPIFTLYTCFAQARICLLRVAMIAPWVKFLVALIF